jgi:hypothetical protein
LAYDENETKLKEPDDGDGDAEGDGGIERSAAGADDVLDARSGVVRADDAKRGVLVVVVIVRDCDLLYVS